MVGRIGLEPMTNSLKGSHIPKVAQPTTKSLKDICEWRGGDKWPFEALSVPMVCQALMTARSGHLPSGLDRQAA